jgi:hypothetical protein
VFSLEVYFAFRKRHGQAEHDSQDREKEVDSDENVFFAQVCAQGRTEA